MSGHSAELPVESPTLRLDLDGRSVDLRRMVDRLVPHLSPLTPGATVASLCNDRLFNLALLLLLPRLGLRFMPLNPAMPQALKERLLSLGQARLVLVGPDELPDPEGPAPRREALPVDSVWLLLATSGTSGDPRLVELTGRNLHSSAQAANRLLQFGQRDRWLACLPMFHVGGLAIVIRAQLSRGSVALMGKFHPDHVLERIARGDITHLSLVPTMLHGLLQAAPEFRPPPTLRVVLLGGAPAPLTMVNEGLSRGWPLCPSYGMTEAASQISTLYPPPRKWAQGLVGRPLPHLEVKIGTEGEILIRGRAVAARARSPLGCRKLLDSEGWLNTGDLGRLDERGRLWIGGRKSDLLVTGGEKVQPLTVETELLQVPGVEEAGVVSIPDAHWGEALVAFYAGKASSREVRRLARRRLQGAYLPKHFFRVEKLPFSPAGKVARKELVALALRLCRGQRSGNP